jgi:hypothetical protein
MTDINYKAWARNMMTFIRLRGLEQDFKFWSGGWPCPVESSEQTAEIERLRAALRDAHEKAAKVADDHARIHRANRGRFSGPNQLDVARSDAAKFIADDIRALGEAKEI